MTKRRNPSDFIGVRFGRFIALSRAENRNGHSCWLCICDCGKYVEVAQATLLNGQSRSCGCLKNELSIARSTTHGHTANGKYPPEYQSWTKMLRRCNNPETPDYYNYGGRGIKVDARWNDFANFIADIGYRPTLAHTLERKDNEAGYSKENCIWATRIEQARNRRTNRIIEIGGKSLKLFEWLALTGILKSTFYARMKKGWSAERALSEPTEMKYSTRGKRHVEVAA